MPMDDMETLVRIRAYEIWEAAGRPHGHALDHWFQAIKETTATAPSIVTPDAPPKRARKPAAKAVPEPEPVAAAPAKKRTARAKA